MEIEIKHSPFLTTSSQKFHITSCGHLFHSKQVCKQLSLPNICQEVVNGLKVYQLPNFMPVPNPIRFQFQRVRNQIVSQRKYNLVKDDTIEQNKHLHQQPTIKIEETKNQPSTDKQVISSTINNTPSKPSVESKCPCLRSTFWLSKCSDRDPRLLSNIWEIWAKTMDSKPKIYLAHRAQAYGLSERMNREIIKIITKNST
ncbi:hypothetical protein ACTFIW_013338 [Dictyostelium discoideum]